jgi:hypothetical protein
LKLQCELDELDMGELMRVAHRATYVVTSQLGVSMDSVAGLEVRVEAGGRSSALGRTIVVSLPNDRGTLSTSEWFELLYSHELTHVVVESQWGRPPVLWWEGLSISLGDDRVRARVLGHSYHQHCRALDLLGVLLPMGPLLTAGGYYERRGDYRVDVQAGSLCGYLLQVHGAESLRQFVSQAECPRPGNPCLRINPALRRNFGTDFEGLVDQWRHWLRQIGQPDDALLDKLRRQSFDDAPSGRPHCEFCYAPLAGERCPACGAAPGTVIEIC